MTLLSILLILAPPLALIVHEIRTRIRLRRKASRAGIETPIGLKRVG